MHTTQYLIFSILLLAAILPIKFCEKENASQIFTRSDTNIIRGLSAFFVIVSHYQIWFDKMIRIQTPSYIKLSFGQLGGIGVLLFFFVSGYGIQETYGGKKVDYRFLLKRITGVYIPYIIIKFLLLPERYLYGITDEPFWREVINIFLISDWFIFVIMLQYSSYYISMRFFRRFLLLASVITDLIFTAIFIYLKKPIGWFNALWLFTFGIVVSILQRRIKHLIDKNAFIFAMVMMVAFVAFGILFALNKGVFWANAIKPISGAFLCLALAAIFKFITIKSPIARWGGTRSMYLYIVHITMWDCFFWGEYPFLGLLLCLGLTIVATEILFRVADYITAIIKRKLTL